MKKPMTPSKPDAFEKQVEALMNSVQIPASPDEHRDALEARWRTELAKQYTKLLRSSHRKIERLVRVTRKSMEGVNNAQGFLNGYASACTDLLTALKALRR